MARKPSFFLLDEPFSAQDPKMRDRLQVGFAEIQKELGASALLISHNVEEVRSLATQIFHLEDGKILEA